METAHVLYCIWHCGLGLQRTLWEASLLSAFLLLCDFASTEILFQVPYVFFFLKAGILQKFKMTVPYKMKGSKAPYHKQ